MYRQFLLASVGAIAIAGSAFAADLPYRAAPPAYLPPVPIFTWTGLYAGGQIGYLWGNDIVEARNSLGEFGAFRFSPQGGLIGGIHLGYNLQIAQWVAGLEGTVDGTTLNSSFGPSAFAVTYTTRSEVQGSIRVRAGFAFDRLLLYATGGAAFAGIDTNYFLNLAPFTVEHITRTHAGWTVGGGLEYAVTNNWSVRAEYRYSDFGPLNDTPFTAITAGPLFVHHHLTENQVQAGFSYKFDSGALYPVVAKY